MQNQIMILKITEAQIQKTVIAYLSHRKDVYFARVGSGMISTETGNCFRSGRRGCPDILLCHKGKFIGFEIKSKIGIQGGDQKIAEEDIKKAGGEYYIIRSLDDAIKILGGK